MNNKWTFFSSRSGFTLLEIIISITILSFLMLGVYFLTENSTEGSARTIKEDQFKVQIEAALNRIDQDFSQIYTPLFYKPLKKKKTKQTSTDSESSSEEFPSFEVNDRFPILTSDHHPVPVIKSDSSSELLFLSFINQRKIRNSKESHFVWIKYMLRNAQVSDENKNAMAPYELVRYYIPSDIYAPEFDFDKIRPSALLDHIKKFEFKFWNPDKKKFVDDLKMMDNPHLIRAIKVELSILDKKNAEYKFERIFRSVWPLFDPGTDEDTTKSNKPGNNSLESEPPEPDED